MPQTSLPEYVEALEKAGLLTRYKDETRVDELPSLMELARSMYALGLECDETQIGQRLAELSERRHKPLIVATAPCKDVILRGHDVDLTILPLFLHHPKDGHAYLDETNVVSRDPETGLIDQGIYRFMFRSKTDLNIYLLNDAHFATVQRYSAQGKDMPIAVVIGAPTLDAIASDVSYPGVDAQESGVAEASVIRQGPVVDRDADLVERLRRQEPGAAEALVATYGDRLYRLAIRITGNRSDAEEVVQNALWSVTRKIDTFRGMAAFWSWVYRITANAAYQQQRGRRIERNGRSWACFDETDEHLDPEIDWSPRLKDAALQTELPAMLCEAIDELPPEHRATFVLHDVEGLSNGEIAETLQIELATVKSRVHRARLRLRSRLAAYVNAAPMLS